MKKRLLLILNDNGQAEIVDTKRYLAVMRARSKNYDATRRKNLLWELPKISLKSAGERIYSQFQKFC